MQMSLQLDESPRLVAVHPILLAAYGPQPFWNDPLDPTSQMVRSMLGGRTKDEVSWPAFMRLASAFPDWAEAAHAKPKAIEALVADVTHADAKARHLPLALRLLKIRRGDFELDFLAEHPVEAAIGWLTQLPGVGVKVAASVLNFSRLHMRALVVDTHVHRVARRLGLVAWSVDATKAYGVLMDAAPAAWGPGALYELHWLMKLLGQRCCTHSAPRCHLCPLRAQCPKHGVDGAAVLRFDKA